MTNNNTDISIPFWGGLFYPFKIINQNSPRFVALTSIFAAITTFMATILGANSSCYFKHDTVIYCSTSVYASITFIVIITILLSLYVYRLHIITTTNVSVKDTLKTLYLPQDLKTLVIICLNYTSLALIVYSAYLLYKRVPTPNFTLEAVYFLIFSSVICLSFFYLLNNILCLRFIEKKNWLALRDTFWPILDNLYKFIFWCSLYFLFFTWLTKAFLEYMLTSPETAIFYMIGDFLMYFITYTILAQNVDNCKCL